MTFRKNLKYFQDKIKIDKAVNKRTAYKIQVYNNNKIDEYIKSYNEDELTEKPKNSLLWAELAVLNKPEVYKNYNHILNSKYTSNDAVNKILIKNKANKDLNRIVEAEVERISKNLQYVEQVMQKYEIPTKMYEELKAKQKQNSIANRQEILNQVAIKANDLLVSEGINVPSNVFSYKNLDATAENLLRQSQMTSKYEEIQAINENYVNQGKDKIYNSKQWIWTGKGKTTRHASNHLQKRNLNEPFIVVNDKTLHIDELMYPSDPAGSAGNTFICYCECEYLTEEQETWDILDSPILNSTNNENTSYNKPIASKNNYNKKIIFGGGKKILSQFKTDNVENVVDKPLDINKLDSGLMVGEYKLPKDFDTSKIEILGYDPDESGAFTIPIATEEAIKEYNKKYANIVFPIDEMYDDTANTGMYGLQVDKLTDTGDGLGYKGIPADKIINGYGWFKKETILEINGEKLSSTPKFVDASALFEFEDGIFDFDPTTNSEINKNDIKFNKEKGIYEYNGVEIQGDYGDNGYGYILVSDVIETNKKLIKVEESKPETISLSDLEEFGSIHYIDTLEYPNLLEDIKFNPKTHQYEYKGLEIKGDFENKGYGHIDTDDIIKHNAKILGVDNEQIDNDNSPIIDNKYINSMKSIKPIKENNKIFIEDKKTGKKYIYDEKAKNEKKQDKEQYKVNYNSYETSSTKHWGRYGHQIINGLIYGVKQYYEGTNEIKRDYSYFNKYMKKLTPHYNRIQDLAIKRQNGEISDEKYHEEKNKILPKINKIIESVKDPNDKSKLNLTEIKDAMWEIVDMDTSIEKSPNLLQDTFFVRFGHFNDEWCEEGKVVKYDGYTSTTYESGAAQHFESKMEDNPNRWAILIMADEGSNGVRLNNQFSALTTEREWLLARNQKFEVIEFDKKNRTAVIKLIN